MSTRHGTPAGYRDDRCKCDPCKDAIAKEHNVYKLRRAANGGPLTVPKLGSVRRLQALMALGWPRRELARQAGYKGDAFALILNSGRTSLTLATAARIDDLYDRLSMTHGPSERTRQLAAAKGWPPSLAWDDIDTDPEPHGWQYATPDRADALTDLDELGAGITTACDRLGVNRKALEKWCRRAGMSDVYSRIVARETPQYWANQHAEGVA